MIVLKRDIHSLFKLKKKGKNVSPKGVHIQLPGNCIFLGKKLTLYQQKSYIDLFKISGIVAKPCCTSTFYIIVYISGIKWYTFSLNHIGSME